MKSEHTAYLNNLCYIKVINVKSPIDAYRLTTARVNEMFASCLQRRREIMIS